MAAKRAHMTYESEMETMEEVFPVHLLPAELRGLVGDFAGPGVRRIIGGEGLTSAVVLYIEGPAEEGGPLQFRWEGLTPPFEDTVRVHIIVAAALEPLEDATETPLLPPETHEFKRVALYLHNELRAYRFIPNFGRKVTSLHIKSEHPSWTLDVLERDYLGRRSMHAPE